MTDPATIERAAQLMRDYELDEIACPEFTIKKSRHQVRRTEPTDKDLLEQHLKELPAEPWMSVPQAEADRWAEKPR
jgi:hypothetical protein